MPPPAPSSSGGGLASTLKRLPPWAWVLAIAGGAIVGFLLLKPGGELEEDAGDELDDVGGEAGRGSGAGGGPARTFGEALGLVDDGAMPEYSEGFAEDEGGSGQVDYNDYETVWSEQYPSQNVGSINTGIPALDNLLGNYGTTPPESKAYGPGDPNPSDAGSTAPPVIDYGSGSQVNPGSGSVAY